MSKIIRNSILVLMVLFSISIMTEKRYDYITYEEYRAGLEKIDPDYTGTGAIMPQIQVYLNRHYTIDGKYFRISNNWKEGTFYLLGTLLVAVYFYQNEVEKKEEVE